MYTKAPLFARSKSLHLDQTWLLRWQPVTIICCWRSNQGLGITLRLFRNQFKTCYGKFVLPKSLRWNEVCVFEAFTIFSQSLLLLNDWSAFVPVSDLCFSQKTWTGPLPAPTCQSMTTVTLHSLYVVIYSYLSFVKRCFQYQDQNCRL